MLFNVAAKMNYLCGAGFRAFAAGGTFAVVDPCQIVLNMDSVVFALFLTELAADTAAFADAPHYFSYIRGGAANVYLLVDVTQDDKLIGTYLGAKSAADALCFVNTCKTVLDENGVLRADLGAVPEAETAVGADLRAVVEAVCRLAGLYSLKNKFALRGVAVAAAKNHRDLRYNSHFLHAHDLGYFFRALCAAGLAHICGNAVLYDSACVVGAARKAAGSAVYLRENFVHRLNALVGFYLENF